MKLDLLRLFLNLFRKYKHGEPLSTRDEIRVRAFIREQLAAIAEYRRNIPPSDL